MTRGLICAVACLPAGFGVAVATGVRPLGGIILLVLALLAARSAPATRGRRLAWYLVVVICFAAAHLLGHAIGAWPAVAVVAVVATGAYVALLQRRRYEAFVPSL
jgi:hypothetical protein